MGNYLTKSSLVRKDQIYEAVLIIK